MQIIVCERCGDEVDPAERTVLGLCPNCLEEEERLERLGAELEEEDDEEAELESV